MGVLSIVQTRSEVIRKNDSEGNTMRKLITIEGMSCGHCVMHVKSALSEIDGVTKVDVDLIKKSAMVQGENLNEIALRHAVVEAGYRVSAVLGGR